MKTIKFDIFQPPEALKHDVECFRIAEYSGTDRLVINVSLNGLPGIVFQHRDGHSPIESITTRSGGKSDVPTLYVYGQQINPGVMTHKPGGYTLTQVILKPHALSTLFGINATALTSDVVALDTFSAPNLNERLLEAHSQPARVNLLSGYLLTRLEDNSRDVLVEESLHLIDRNIGAVTVRNLLERLNISERQFERRFSQTVGVSPHFYIRVKRFNAAIRLMTTRRFSKLADVAYALHYYDQSHFIRDIKEFSGITPKNLSQKIDDFRAEQPIYAHL